MESEIQKLVQSTTIVKVEDYRSGEIIAGDKFYFSISIEDPLRQHVDLNTLEKNWERKWNSFGNNWTEERQSFRFLYGSFKLFYFSFEQLIFNRVASIDKIFKNKLEEIHFNELAGVSLYSMYHHGRKCIDLLVKLRLKSVNENSENSEFLKKFRETRNKLFEHNYNPNGFNLQLDPSIGSLISSQNLLEVHIHKTNTVERMYDAYIDFYKDYYRLEEIITDVIKTF